MLVKMNCENSGGDNTVRPSCPIQPMTVTSSSDYSSSFYAVNAVFLNTSQNGWIPASSDSDPYLKIDLGSAKSISEVIYGRVASSSSYAYDSYDEKVDIEVSTDDSTYTPVTSATISMDGYTGYKLAAIPMGGVSARYIKFKMTTDSSKRATAAGVKALIFEKI